MQNICKNLFLLFVGISLVHGMNQDHADGQFSSRGGNHQIKVVKNPIKRGVSYYFSTIGELGRLPLDLLEVIFKKAIQPENGLALTTEPLRKEIEKFIRQRVTQSITWKAKISDADLFFLNGGWQMSNNLVYQLPNGNRASCILKPLPHFPSLFSNLRETCMQGQLSDRALMTFSLHTNLTSLKLRDYFSFDCPYNGRGLASLSTLTKLKRLALANYLGLTDQEFSSLSNLVNLTSLKLDTLKNFSGNALEVLSKLVKLNSLSLDDCAGVQEENYVYLSNLTNLTSLEVKNVEDLPDDIISILAKISKLTYLSLESSPRVEEDLAQLSKLENLLSLNLFCSWSPDELPSLSSLTKLTSLDLGIEMNLGPLIGDIIILHLSNLANLKSLHLECWESVTDVGLSHISRFTNLTDLNLGGLEGITDNGLIHFSNFKNLTSLFLDFCKQLTGDGLAHLSNCTNLRTLNLRECKNITDKGLLYLSNFTKLTAFDFEGLENITNQGLSKLFASANFKHIRRTNVEGCSMLSDEGSDSLSDFV